jgi:site-specific recombinase XerD
MRRPATPLLALVQSFFQGYLRSVRGASDHTVRAYRDALRLYFCFVAERTCRPPATVGLDDIRADLVLAFLNHLETARHNCSATRNNRLAAIHCFAAHLLRHDLTRAEQYSRILAIPAKRAHLLPPTYLEPQDVRILIAQPDATSTEGMRDLALLLLLYNTGARVGEALAVRIPDLHLMRPCTVRLRGKGGKERLCPLWPHTVRALRALLQHPSLGPGEDREIFRNARGEPLGRDGAAYLIAKYTDRAAQECPRLRGVRVTPHVLRHSCAVALLQAGVDLTVIRDYLGHASVATTGRYLSANLEMKRKALDTFWRHAGLTRSPQPRWRPSQDTLAYLTAL